jgi:hypothetical protein
MSAIKIDDVMVSTETETEGLYPLSDSDVLSDYQKRDYRTKSDTEMRRRCMSSDLRNAAAITQNIVDTYDMFLNAAERARLKKYVGGLEALATQYTLTQKDIRERDCQLARRAINSVNTILDHYDENGWARICTKKSLRASLKTYKEILKTNTD